MEKMWICPRCETSNFIELKRCEVCNCEIPWEFRPPEILDFTADFYKIIKGSRVTLSWHAQRYTSILLNGTVVTHKESYTEVLTSTKQFKLEVFKGDEYVSDSLYIKVERKPVINVEVNKSEQHRGEKESATIKWKVYDAYQISLLRDGKVIYEKCHNKGSFKFVADDNTTFVLRVLALDRHTIVDKSITYFVQLPGLKRVINS